MQAASGNSDDSQMNTPPQPQGEFDRAVFEPVRATTPVGADAEDVATLEAMLDAALHHIDQLLTALDSRSAIVKVIAHHEAQLWREQFDAPAEC